MKADIAESLFDELGIDKYEAKDRVALFFNKLSVLCRKVNP